MEQEKLTLKHLKEREPFTWCMLQTLKCLMVEFTACQATTWIMITFMNIWLILSKCWRYLVSINSHWLTKGQDTRAHFRGGACGPTTIDQHIKSCKCATSIHPMFNFQDFKSKSGKRGIDGENVIRIIVYSFYLHIWRVRPWWQGLPRVSK